MTTMKTLTRYYIYAVLSGLQFGWTTWLAYVLLRGGNPGWAEGTYHLAILLGEVPTGIVADLVGRRTSMLIGLAVGAVASFSYPAINNTLTACLVLGLSGLGGTFLSGADTALLYETALAEGGADLARRAMARVQALQMAALATAPIIAGYLFQWQPLAPFLSRGVLILITMVVVWGMADQPLAKPTAAPGKYDVWSHTRTALQIVLKNPALLGMILFSWTYNAVGAMTNQFGQAYFPYTGLSMIAAGFIFAGARLLSAGGSKLSERLSTVTSLRFLRFAPLGQSLAYVGMGLGGGWLGAAFFLLGETLDGVVYPTLQYQVNEVVPSAQRATILSLQSAGFSMLMAAAFPAASYLSPITKIYVATGAVGAIVAIAWMVWRGRSLAVR